MWLITCPSFSYCIKFTATLIDITWFASWWMNDTRRLLRRGILVVLIELISISTPLVLLVALVGANATRPCHPCCEKKGWVFLSDYFDAWSLYLCRSSTASSSFFLGSPWIALRSEDEGAASSRWRRIVGSGWRWTSRRAARRRSGGRWRTWWGTATTSSWSTSRRRAAMKRARCSSGRPPDLVWIVCSLLLSPPIPFALSPFPFGSSDSFHFVQRELSTFSRFVNPCTWCRPQKDFWCYDRPFVEKIEFFRPSCT